MGSEMCIRDRANVIVLDEPTNDLDSETLELLEEQLVQFGGTLLMVSHDRTFLNNVVTSTIVFEEDGANEYVGGYDAWQAIAQRRQKESKGKSEVKPKASKEKSSDSPSPAAKPAGKKLSFNEQQELKKLPGKIEGYEKSIAKLHEAMAEPGYYQLGGDKIAEDAASLKELESNLAAAFERWEQLEG